MNEDFIKRQIVKRAAARRREAERIEARDQHMDPADAETHRRLFRSHPIVKGGYVMPTPPIKRGLDIISRQVLQHKPGCAFAAHPRFGKTYAIRYLAHTLPQTFPGVPIYRVVGRKSRSSSPNAFFRDLYAYCGGQYRPRRRDTDVALDLLVRRWQIQAAAGGVHQVIVFVDEMQRLTLDELTYLADATNKYSNDDYRATLICFGSTELASMRDLAMLGRRGDLLGRFFTPFCAFDGIGSAAELQEVLRGYDDPEVAEYPNGSGWSYSRFFFSRAYKAGWRLESEAGELWTAFTTAACQRTERGAAVGLNVGMEWIASAIEAALVDNSPCNPINVPISKEAWRHAVSVSGFIESLGITYEPGDRPVSPPRQRVPAGQEARP